MNNIITYTRDNLNTFDSLPFNSVDSLILSSAAYFRFPESIPEIISWKGIRLQELYRAEYFQEMFRNVPLTGSARQLFYAMAASPRFRDIRIMGYTDLFDPQQEKQFSAVTFCFQPNLYYIAYRGTDSTLIGWKEDFNMAFSKPVAGQRLAAIYLNQVSKCFDDSFVVCGHSKGGNFAVYSSINVNNEMQERISIIYSFDGPGFRPEILHCEDYDKISHKICKLIPRSSLVGMLLENHEDYEVIASYNHGMMQHDPFSWKVQELEFKRVSKMDASRLVRSNAFNEWVLKLDDNQLLIFVETLFHVLKECDIKTTYEIQDDFKNKATQIVTAGMNLDVELKNQMIELSKGYFENIYEGFKTKIIDKRKK